MSGPRNYPANSQCRRERRHRGNDRHFPGDRPNGPWYYVGEASKPMTKNGNNMQPLLRVFLPQGEREKGFLVKLRAFLPDWPGSLARFAASIAASGGNIAFFHYDRAIDSSRVVAEVQSPDASSLEALKAAVAPCAVSAADEAARPDDVQITSTDNILEIKVRLENRPGALAAFAELLARHGANVTYMLHDEDIDAGSATMAMATRDTAEIDVLLNGLNAANYHYRVIYRGTDVQEVQHVIGLKLVEKFFLRLKLLLPSSTVDELRSIVQSSKELEQDLIGFSAEAGNDLETGDVFEKVLTLASRSRTWTGNRFHSRAMPARDLPGGVKLFGFRMPTSENVYLFRHGDELTMIDAGHGIYYNDFKELLRKQGMGPAQVKRIFITHPDTDHTGMAGYFEQEFGSRVFIHADSEDVIKHQNRAWGATGSLLNLNRYYTKLSSRFTECRYPIQLQHFPAAGTCALGGFKIIDSFPVGSLSFLVLESHGGHTPGLVFYLNQEEGLLFTSDFLINIPSLQPDEKEHLGIYRYLLTNPNRDSAVYKEETAALKEMAGRLDRELRISNKQLTIYPGHGTQYPAAELH